MPDDSTGLDGKAGGNWRLGSDWSIELRREELCDKFEQAAESGQPLAIEALLEQVDGVERSELLAELIAIESERRHRAGESISWEKYAARFPSNVEAVQQARRLHESSAPAALGAPGRKTHHRGVDDHTGPLDGKRKEPRPNLELIGRYEIRDVIGAGGMGVVYRAYHPDLKRDVAVKMVRGGEQAPEEHRRRFRAEATVIARMQHPGVVQIYDVGEHEGHPYFVMELVAGGSLTGRLAAGALSADEAAQLLEKITQGLQAMHNAGIVHRDLKPSNILLTEDGEPKITDFGLAKQLEDQSHTQTGQLLGTPSYMAPEQATGRQDEITPTTDVYALGAILFESLTREPPFREASTYETIRKVREEPASPPSSLAPQIPRDLDTICLKCLEKDPARRYVDARTLGEDLRRFLDRRPILARPVPWFERVYRHARRFPVASSLAAALFIGLVVGLAIVTGLLREANYQRTTAQSQESRARHFLTLAIRAIEDVVEELANHPAFVPEGRLAPVRRDVLERAQQLYEEVVKYEPEDRQLRIQLAQAASGYSDILEELESPQTARPHFEQALQRWLKLVEEQADRQVLFGAAHAAYSLANVSVKMAANDAHVQLDQAEQLAKRLEKFHETHPATGDPVSGDPREQYPRLLRADVQLLRAMHLINSVRSSEAEQILLNSLEMLATCPDIEYRERSEAECLRALAALALRQENYQRSIEYYEKTLTLLGNRRTAYVAELQSSYADLLELTGQPKEALAKLEEAAATLDLHCRENPFDLDSRASQIELLAKIGTFHLQMASDAVWRDEPYDVEAATRGLAQLDNAIALQRLLISEQPTFTRSSRYLARLLYSRALGCKSLDRLDEAEKSLEESGKLLDEALANDTMTEVAARKCRETLMNVLGEAGQVAGMQNDFVRAEQQLERAKAIADLVMLEEPSLTARAEMSSLWLDLAHARLELNKLPAGVEVLEQLLEDAKTFPQDHPFASRVRFNCEEALKWLAEIYAMMEDLENELHARQRRLPYLEGEALQTERITTGSIQAATGRLSEALESLRAIDPEFELDDEAQWAVLATSALIVAQSPDRDSPLCRQALAFYHTTRDREIKSGRWTAEELDRQLAQLPAEIQEAVADRREDRGD